MARGSQQLQWCRLRRCAAAACRSRRHCECDSTRAAQTQAAACSEDDEEDVRSSAFKHKRAGAAPPLPLSAKKRRKLKQFLVERAR
jgi:hypothetical protein